MTDQTARDVTDDDRRFARDWAEHIFNTPDASLPMEAAAARVILSTVPAPPPPTLADMTPEERSASRWMQCDHGIPGRSRSRGVIGYFDYEDEKAVILTTTGGILRRDYDRVTPRPDLPRLEWPGDQKPDPAPALPSGWRLADHPRYGRVLVTTPEPDCDGDLWFIDPSAEPGSMEHWCDPDMLTFLDQEADQ